MAPKRHAKPLYDFDGLVAAARRQSIDVREDNGHFYFSNKNGMVDMRREEVTAGRRSWNSHVSRLRRIGLVWASKVDKLKTDQLEQQFAAESSQLIQQFQAVETTYPSLAHVASGPGFLFELPVEESAQVIEEIKETEMTEADKGRGIGEKKHINTGSPEGWSASEAHTKVYRNRMNRESRKFLREFLKDGPKELHEIRNAALAAGLTWYQVEKASTSLKIVKKLHGPRYPGTWELPESGKRENMVEALKDAGYREVPSPAERAWTPSTLIPPGKGGGLIAPPVSAEANGEPRNADPGPGTYPPPEPASRGIVSPDVSPAAGQDFQSLHRSPFALGIANLVEQELTFRVKEWIEKAERLEREKSGLLQQLADMQHEHDRNWDKIQQEALEAAQKSVAEAIAAAKKR